MVWGLLGGGQIAPRKNAKSVTRYARTSEKPTFPSLQNTGIWDRFKSSHITVESILFIVLNLHTYSISYRFHSIIYFAPPSLRGILPHLSCNDEMVEFGLCISFGFKIIVHRLNDLESRCLENSFPPFLRHQ